MYSAQVYAAFVRLKGPGPGPDGKCQWFPVGPIAVEKPSQVNKIANSSVTFPQGPKKLLSFMKLLRCCKNKLLQIEKALWDAEKPLVAAVKKMYPQVYMKASDKGHGYLGWADELFSDMSHSACFLPSILCRVWRQGLRSAIGSVMHPRCQRQKSRYRSCLPNDTAPCIIAALCHCCLRISVIIFLSWFCRLVEIRLTT